MKGRTGIFGGTFNPPHAGHIEAARSCVEALSLGRLLMIPTNIPPHKTLPQGSPDSAQRFEMTKIAASLVPMAEALDIEIKRLGPSYTADTVKEIRKLYPKDTLWLIVGTDMLETFDSWYKPQDIVSVCRIAAVARSVDDRQRIIKKARQLEKDLGARVDIIYNHVTEGSSTDFRTGRKRHIVPSDIMRYIDKNGLYNAGFREKQDELERKVRPMLTEKRYIHTLGWRKMADMLAQRWGCDREKACTAAMLHDITKKLTDEEQLQLCKRYGIINKYAPHEFSQLIHADTAAALAEDVFHMPPDIVRAIKLHTLGSEDMTLLDKIIYLSDAIEENRAYPGVEDIRKAAFEDLDNALLMSMESTLANIRQKGREPNPQTARAHDALKKSISCKGEYNGA